MDKAQLLKVRVPEGEVEIPDVGTVRVRGLTREEAISARKATDSLDNIDGARVLVLERKMLALAMIDPALTEDEVAEWQRGSPAGELEPVVLKIQELSGMLDDAAKGAYKSV